MDSKRKKVKVTTSLKFGLLPLLLLLIGLIVFNNIMVKTDNKILTTLTKNEAITLIKKQYPQFTEYPSDNLPPRTIATEQAPNGWYIQFMQQGSGIPIISAHCFWVGYDNEIRRTGEYKGGDTTKMTLSVSSCQ